MDKRSAPASPAESVAPERPDTEAIPGPLPRTALRDGLARTTDWP